MANRWNRKLVAATMAAVLLTSLVAGGTGAEARPFAPPATCPGPSPCAAPWMARVTNLTVGRTPQVSDFTTVSPTDNPNQATRAAVAEGLLTSPEGRGFTVELHYYRVLQRAPDPSGADYWPRAMLEGRRNTELLEASLLGSHEFSRKWPDWITQMYDVVLARQPDPRGLAYWTDQATRTSNERVARRFLSSPAARRERARIIYASLLAGIRGSGPTAAEITRGASLLGLFAGEDELIVEILSSAEVYVGSQTV